MTTEQGVDQASQNGIRVRTARDSDFDAIISMMRNELGYPMDEVKFHRKLERISAHPDHRIFVADADGNTVGFVGFYRAIEYEREDDYLRLAILGVKQKYWHRGIGTILLEAVEGFGRSRNLTHFELDSRLWRRGAHAFYEANGYRKFSYAFRKDI